MLTRSRVNESRPVIVLGLLLITVALAWGLLTGGALVSIKKNYVHGGGQTRSIVITNGDEEPIIGQVSSHGVVDVEMNDAPSASSIGSVDAPEPPFSFPRDILGIYQPVDWGKGVRVLMYVFGGLLLLISNVRRK